VEYLCERLKVLFRAICRLNRVNVGSSFFSIILMLLTFSGNSLLQTTANEFFTPQEYFFSNVD
jgi:hypothetical protein